MTPSADVFVVFTRAPVEIAATIAIIVAVTALNASLLRDDILLRIHVNVLSSGRFIRLVLTLVPAVLLGLAGRYWPSALVAFLDMQSDLLARVVPSWIAVELVAALNMLGVLVWVRPLSDAPLTKPQLTWRDEFLASMRLATTWCLLVVGIFIARWLAVFWSSKETVDFALLLIIVSGLNLLIAFVFFGGIFKAVRWATWHPSTGVNLAFLAVVAVGLVVGTLAIFGVIPEPLAWFGVAGVAALIMWSLDSSGSLSGLRGLHPRDIFRRAARETPPTFGLKQFDPPK